MSSGSGTHARTNGDAQIGDLERMTFALESSGLSPWEWDMRTGEISLDDAFVELLGLTSEQFGPPTFDTYVALCHPDDVEAIREALARHVDGAEERYDLEFRIKHADGNWRWIHGRGRIARRDADGTPTRMIGTHGDVSERRRREQELTVLTQQLDTAQRMANVGSWYFDAETGDVTWTRELYRMMHDFDRSRTPAPGESHIDMFSVESWERLTAAIDATRVHGEPHELELELQRGGQHVGWILARGEAVRDPDGTIIGVQGVAMDVTERKQRSEVLERLASRDALTGLLNRSSMLEELAVTVREAREGAVTGTVACLLVDLDNFKFINDSLGHALGDLVLQAAARRIEHVARARDVTARLGGDEFVVLLRDLSSAEAADDVAERIVDAFREPMSIEGHDLILTASVGVAIHVGEQEAGDLLRDADTAMYAAKTAGRDQAATFVKKLRTGIDERPGLEFALRAASDSGELEAWFQPEVDLETGRVTAGEALVRWRHPDGTITSAVDFIGASEETGLIRRIGAHILRGACEAAIAWQADGPIGVKVNTSVVQLAEPGFLRLLDHTLAETGLRPDLLCLEFTEAVLLRETTTILANIHGIAERGVSIAIDNFGTEYASLSALHRYAVNVVKIDRRFVDLCGIDLRSTQLVESIVRLGEIMGIDVIAEGVETTQQARTVLGLGCTRAQGYLFSPAVPSEEFLELIVSGFDPIVMPVEDATAG